MHRRPVDDQRPAARARRPSARPPQPGGRAASAARVVETTPDRGHPPDPPRGWSREPAGARRPARRRHGPRRRVRGGVEHDRGGIEQHALQHRGAGRRRRRRRPPPAATARWRRSRGRSGPPALRGLRHPGRRAAPRTSQPSPRAGGRTGSGRSATRAGVPSGVMLMPSSVEWVSSAQTASSGSSSASRPALRSTAAAACSHSATSWSCPSASDRWESEPMGEGYGPASAARPATVKYPTRSLS